MNLLQQITRRLEFVEDVQNSNKEFPEIEKARHEKYSSHLELLSCIHSLYGVHRLRPRARPVRLWDR